MKSHILSKPSLYTKYAWIHTLIILVAIIFNPGYTTHLNAQSPNFQEHSINNATLSPTAVFSMDLDGDGDQDVLSASYIDDKIAWYENDGKQNFTERVISSSADAAWSVYALDLDGDGDQDVLSASGNDDKIAWYENDGAQNFTERVISSSADGAWSVYALDLDGDGDQDVLSASFIDDKIAWYENDGKQNFTERVISSSADGAASVYALDLDGDGDQDVFSASGNDGKIAWYENLLSKQNSPLTLQNPIQDTTIVSCTSLITYDLNAVFNYPNDDSTTFTVLSNSNPDLFSATILDRVLELSLNSNTFGAAEIIIQASYNEFMIKDTFEVVVLESSIPEIQGPIKICKDEYSIYTIEADLEYIYDWEVLIDDSAESLVFKDTTQIEVHWKDQSGTVILTATHANLGCKLQSRLDVQILQNKIFLPNTFSPNQDNMNDHFYLLLSNHMDQISSLDIKIYSRAGFLVYQTNDMAEATNNQGGWDGDNYPPGVYIYEVKIDFANCNNQILRGSVRLIR